VDDAQAPGFDPSDLLTVPAGLFAFSDVLSGIDPSFGATTPVRVEYEFFDGTVIAAEAQIEGYLF
jgi:hypothetical protein